MTDPRIAALAEALQAALYPGEDMDRDENLWIEQDTKTLAAAILAALPPDWCGHDLAAIRDRAWQDGVNAANVKEEVELARLRKIEEAAQETIEVLEKHIIRLARYWRTSHIETYANEAIDALRAALGESDA